MTVTLRPVTAKNLWDIVALSPAPGQERYVATNTQSILEAYTTVTAGGVALPFGIYDGDTPVGFAMLGFGCADWEDAPAIAAGSYSIWRLMIDRNCQGRGYGKAAMEAILTYIRTFPCGPSDTCWLSYVPGNRAAEHLYHSFGFRETGDMDGDEIIAALSITPSPRQSAG